MSKASFDSLRDELRGQLQRNESVREVDSETAGGICVQNFNVRRLVYNVCTCR